MHLGIIQSVPLIMLSAQTLTLLMMASKTAIETEEEFEVDE